MKQPLSSKENYAAYREAAIARVEPLEGITIGPHSPVQMMHDGAFVEAQVWIPKAAIKSEAEK